MYPSVFYDFLQQEDAWEDVKSGMDAALENLKNSYNDAVSHFK